MTYKIGICGSHGTGKSTLLNELSKELPVPVIQRTIRGYWESVGVRDFNPMPREVRAEFQKYLLLNQIRVEDEHPEGFLTDRTVLDYIGYAAAQSSMSQVDLSMFEQVIKARLANYSHLIYLPVEFTPQDEPLRAKVETQGQVAAILEEYLQRWLKPGQYLISMGSVDERLEQIRRYLQNF